MKEAVFILIVGDELSDFSMLISRMQHLSPAKNFHKVSDSWNFINTIKVIEDEVESLLDTEIRVIIDLGLPFFEAYVCLQALAGYDYKTPVKVFLLEDEYLVHPAPSIDQYTIAGRFPKPPGPEEIEYILSDQSVCYFRKEESGRSGGFSDYLI